MLNKYVSDWRAPLGLPKMVESLSTWLCYCILILHVSTWKPKCILHCLLLTSSRSSQIPAMIFQRKWCSIPLYSYDGSISLYYLMKFQAPLSEWWPQLVWWAHERKSQQQQPSFWLILNKFCSYRQLTKIPLKAWYEKSVFSANPAWHHTEHHYRVCRIWKDLHLKRGKLIHETKAKYLKSYSARVRLHLLW